MSKCKNKGRFFFLKARIKNRPYFFLKEELADVLVYCGNLLDKLNLDEDVIVMDKMLKNEAKYPIEKSKGKSEKYDKL